MKRGILILAVLSAALESRALFPSRAGIWGDDAQTDWYTTNSAAAVFELGTERDLAGLARLVNQGNSFSGKTLRLTRGVSLGTHFWTPIGNRSPHPFEGSFE